MSTNGTDPGGSDDIVGLAPSTFYGIIGAIVAAIVLIAAYSFWSYRRHVSPAPPANYQAAGGQPSGGQQTGPFGMFAVSNTPPPAAPEIGWRPPAPRDDGGTGMGIGGPSTIAVVPGGGTHATTDSAAAATGGAVGGAGGAAVALPPGWSAQRMPTGQIVYVNALTGLTSYEPPQAATPI
jgi:hypothetical protein